MLTADGLINTTPVGMKEYPGMPIEGGLLRKDMWVADVIYFPLNTELIHNAAIAGCRTMNGGRMAVYQAAHCFKLFTGMQADTNRMLAHFETLHL